MATIRIILGIFCFAINFWSTEPARSILAASAENFPFKKSSVNFDKRSELLTIAQSQIGVTEATGHNDGLAVESYLKAAGLPKGNPWCAAFLSWVFKQAGFTVPRTAWSPALFILAKQTRKPQPGDVFGIYYLKFNRIAHCGMVEQLDDQWLLGVEGNTNVAGAREGGGVYRKRRHLKTIKLFADWVTPIEKGKRYEN